ncbi:hypothetical protein Bca4012_000231 [Brassica carinata]
MTGERLSNGTFKHDDGGGSGGSRIHEGGVVTNIAMERSMAASEGGGKSSVAEAGEIHRRRLGMRKPAEPESAPISDRRYCGTRPCLALSEPKSILVNTMRSCLNFKNMRASF